MSENGKDPTKFRVSGVTGEKTRARAGTTTRSYIILDTHNGNRRNRRGLVQSSRDQLVLLPLVLVTRTPTRTRTSD